MGESSEIEDSVFGTVAFLYLIVFLIPTIVGIILLFIINSEDYEHKLIREEYEARQEGKQNNARSFSEEILELIKGDEQRKEEKDEDKVAEGQPVRMDALPAASGI